MNSIALRNLAEEISVAEKHLRSRQRMARRHLRDESNPLELPQSLFQKYYRINKPAFRYLLEILTTHSQPTKKQFGVPPIVKLSASLRFFAEGGYQTGVGKDCDVSLAQPTFSKVLTEVVHIFETHLCPVRIEVPKTREERRKIAVDFYTKHNIPGVVGCIDGTHNQIIAPSENKLLFYNRKGKYSLNVLLLCDHQQRIRYVDSSHPGACHASFIWNTNELRTYFEQIYVNGETNSWLLGDAGYPLEPWLLTPYRVPEDDTPEMRFNEVHAKCRNIIERTNGVLKNRWRCLLGARELHYSPVKAAKIVNVCCALHNVCIGYNVADDTRNFIEVNSTEEDATPLTTETNGRNLATAQAIRANIAENLF